MDLLSHGLLGAVTAQAGARNHEARIAACVGFLAGLLPDADALIQSPSDPLLVLEYHRHFTHSLVFIPVGALIIACILWPLLQRTLAFSRVFLFALLGISLAGLLDTCTSYGVYLLWPFFHERIAWHIMPIVDPVFTLLIGLPLLIGVIQRKPLIAQIALGLGGFYLAFAVLQSDRALNLAQKVVAERGHQAERLLVKPTIGNLLLWRSVYEVNGRAYVDALRVGLFSGDHIYRGDSLPLLDPDRQDLAPRGSRAGIDLRRFAGLSDDWIVIHPQRPQLVGDIRYAMLPNSVFPLWGILLAAADPDRPPQFITERTFTPAMRRRFIDMLSGQNLQPESRNPNL